MQMEQQEFAPLAWLAFVRNVQTMVVVQVVWLAISLIFN